MNDQEFLEFMAGGLTSKDKEEITLSGFGKVYTSENYKSYLKNIIRKNAPSYSWNILNSLIDGNIITPISYSKSILDYFIRRKEMKKKGSIRGTFYRPEEKIYMFMGLKGIKPKQIVETVFHECMHMAAFKNPKQFLNFNQNQMLKYYLYVYSNFFKANKKDIIKNIHQWMGKALFILEKNNDPTDRYTVDFLNTFDKTSTLDKAEINKKQEIVYNAWNDYIEEGLTYQEGEEVFKYFDEAYIKVFKLNTKRAQLGEVAEEISAPSSVIAKLAAYNPNFPYVKKSLRLVV